MVRDSKKEKKAYKSVVKGKLNLKSGKFKKSKKKSSKKKRKIRDIESESIDSKGTEEKSNDVDAVKQRRSDYEKAIEELTPSEKAFLERQRLNDSTIIKRQSMKTHRQRIEEYNTNLSNLSEHHDIPKVGPG